MILFLLLIMVTRCVGFLVTPVIIIAETRVFRTLIYSGRFPPHGRCSSVMTGPDCFFSLLVPFLFFFYLIVYFRCTSPRPSKHTIAIRLNYHWLTSYCVRIITVYIIILCARGVAEYIVLIIHCTSIDVVVFTFIVIQYVA